MATRKRKRSSKSDRAGESLIYKPISDWQTRILCLEPGTFGAPLKATLHVGDLVHVEGLVLHRQQERVHYSALSYCWGDAKREKQLSCNGHILPITESLYTALQRIRDPHNEIYIWVDAVCINQNDLGERARQVRNMLLIYTKAKEIAVWLGECTQAAQHGLRDALELIKARSFTEGEASTCPEESHNDILTLFDSPWFRRIWVLQEIWAARVTSVRFGPQTTTWESLVALLKASQALPLTISRQMFLRSILDRFAQPTREVRSSVEHQDKNNMFLGELSSLGHIYRSDTELSRVLNRCANSQCTDLRDHIYGITGMCSVALGIPGENTSSPTRLIIDYSSSKTVSSVFADVTRYLMARDQALNVLHLDGKFGATLPGGDVLPSWIPDWRCPNSATPWMSYCSLSGFFLDTDLCPYEVTSTSDPLVLQIEGFTLGLVKEMLKEETDEVHLSLKSLPKDIEQRVQPYARQGVINAINRRLAVPSEELWYDKEPASRHTLPELSGNDHCLTVRVMLPPDMHWEDIALRDEHVISHHLKWSPAASGLSDTYPTDFKPALTFASLDQEVMVQKYSTRWHEFRSWLAGRESNWHEKTFKRVQRPKGTFSLSTNNAYLAEDPVEEWFPNAWATPRETQVGDLVIVVKGSFLPLVVRLQPGKSGFRFIGPAMISEVFAGGAESTRHSQEHPYYGLHKGILMTAMLLFGERERLLEKYRII